MSFPIGFPIPLSLKARLLLYFKFSKEERKEIFRLENDTIKEGEGKISDVRMGLFKRGKCIVFKEKGKIVIITITPEMETKAITHPI